LHQQSTRLLSLKNITPPDPSTYDDSQKKMHDTFTSKQMIQATTGFAVRLELVCNGDGFSDPLVLNWCHSQPDYMNNNNYNSTYHKCISYDDFTNKLLLADNSPYKTFGDKVKAHADESINELKNASNDIVST